MCEVNKYDKINEFIRFAIVGVIATLIHYAIYYLLKFVINYNLAYTIGYALSLLLNFYLSSVFTFREKPTFAKFFGMSAAHGVNYLLHIILLNLFVYLGISKSLAPIPVYAIVVPINFILVRFAFKSKYSE